MVLFPLHFIAVVDRYIHEVQPINPETVPLLWICEYISSHILGPSIYNIHFVFVNLILMLGPLRTRPPTILRKQDHGLIVLV